MIMAFGLVVARFGLFLRALALQQPPSAHGYAEHHGLSNAVGIAPVLIG